MGSMFDVIKERRSVRTYTEQVPDKETIEKVVNYMRSITRGPFGNKTRFELLNFEHLKEKETKPLGTYGIIKGAKLYIAGAVPDTGHAMEDFGYCMEKLILGLTNLGLGTCWMAGTFKRNNFAKQIKLAENELLPAITPVGYGKDKKSLVDRSLRFAAGSKNRKNWDELFYLNDINTMLNKKNAADYYNMLESVRLGPSGSNKQPWRIIWEKDSNNFHFYLKKTKGYGVGLGKIKIQNIDIGIAMCHFELVSNELGKTGIWLDNSPSIEAGDMEYIATWSET